MKTIVDFIVDFIRDDPCHGCKFATLIPDYLLDSYFSRRIGCVNVKRRERLVEKATEILNTSSTPRAVTEALKYLNGASESDEYFNSHCFYKCEDSIGHPECFEQKHLQ